MNENCFNEAQWQIIHEEIQKRFHALADEIAVGAPSAAPRFNKTVTKRFPLFSYVSFHRPQVTEGEYIIVGVDIAPENDQWGIDADVADEEDGTIYFELPRTPFTVANFDDLKDRILRTTDQLISGGKPVLLRLLGGTRSVLPAQPAAAPQATQKA